MRPISIAVVVLGLAVTGCASEPVAVPTPATTAATVEPATTTTTTVDPDDSVPTTSTTTTIPVCELGDALDAVWLVDVGDGHGTAFHIGEGEWITAAHVIGDSNTVVLRHGSDEIEASMVGVDHTTDVALLLAVADDVPTLDMADLPDVGEDVLAAGYPLYGESEPSVTRGVVSRFERDLFLGELVMTDTAVNPGNSGGPLLDLCGAVVGMVVEKIVSMDVEGVGYAVTAAEVQSQMSRLREGYGSEPIQQAEPSEPVVDDLPPLPDGWELRWTDVDLMTGEPFPFIVAWAAEYEHGTDGFYSIPTLTVHCTGDFALHWGGALAFGDLDGYVEADFRVAGGEVRRSRWFVLSDYLTMALWEFTDAATDLDVQARLALDDATMAIRAWDWQNDLIGTAVFPTKDYATLRWELRRECP